MKAWIFRRKKMVFIGLAIALAAISAFSTFGQAVMTAAAKRDLPIYCTQKDYKVCSLTFDAAWGNEDTQQLIDILGKHDIKATFFVVGSWVDKYPESVKALHDAGHEIMNHSSTHPHMPQLSPEQMIKEANECSDKIEAVTGVRPTLFRPPYGDYDDKVVGTLRSAGYTTIQWDVDSLDWKDLGPENVITRVTSKVQPGSIVLFHNAAKDTPPALPTIIEKLIQDGYTFLPVSKLIYTENYTIDHTGRQIPNRSEGTAPSAANPPAAAPTTTAPPSAETPSSSDPSASATTEPSTETPPSSTPSTATASPITSAPTPPTETPPSAGTAPEASAPRA